MGDRLLLVIMIDALGHRIVRESGAFDFLDHQSGPLTAVCGYSSACIPSLLTGRPPAEHGHWAMYLHDPRGSVFKPFRPLIWLTGGLLGRNGFTRRMVTRGLHRLGISGYFNLYYVPPMLLPRFDLCEKRDLFAPGAFADLATPFDVARKLGRRHHVWSWKTPDAENRRELAAAIRAGGQEMLFYYSAHLDAVMHEHGTRSAATTASLQEYAAFIREMLALAEEQYAEVRLFVFGDHGMADIRSSHDLLTPIERLPLHVPGDFLHFVDSTMARFWFFKPGAREQVEELLRGVKYGRVLSDAECERLGILFPDRRYGELIFLADEGALLVPSFMGRQPLAAMHGYHPDGIDSSTVLLTNHPRRRVTSILDLGPLLNAEIEALATPGGGAR